MTDEQQATITRLRRERDDERRLRRIKEGMLNSAERECEELRNRLEVSEMGMCPNPEPVPEEPLIHNHDPRFHCEKCFRDGELAAHATYEDVKDEPVDEAVRRESARMETQFAEQRATLRARVEVLEKALRPFKAAADYIDTNDALKSVLEREGVSLWQPQSTLDQPPNITYKHCAEACAALGGK